MVIYLLNLKGGKGIPWFLIFLIILKKVGHMGNPFEEEYGTMFTKDEKEGGPGMCDKYVASGAVLAGKKQ